MAVIAPACLVFPRVQCPASSNNHRNRCQQQPGCLWQQEAANELSAGLDFPSVRLMGNSSNRSSISNNDTHTLAKGLAASRCPMLHKTTREIAKFVAIITCTS